MMEYKPSDYTVMHLAVSDGTSVKFSNSVTIVWNIVRAKDRKSVV